MSDSVRCSLLWALVPLQLITARGSRARLTGYTDAYERSMPTCAHTLRQKSLVRNNGGLVIRRQGDSKGTTQHPAMSKNCYECD